MYNEVARDELNTPLTSAKDGATLTGSELGGSAPWNRANATKYSGRMLWEQIRTILPIFVFLLGYRGLVLESWVKFGELMGLVGGVTCVVVGLAIFMEGLKSGMMPLGEEVGKAMGEKLSTGGILTLAFVLGILVTMAEPAIATLKQAGSLVHPDPDCNEFSTSGPCQTYLTSPACDENCKDTSKWVPGAPFLYATVNLWSAYRLPITIGTGVGMACTVGMLRSIFELRMKSIIFILVPITLTLTLFIRFAESMIPVRDILGLAWDCGAVTTGPVTVPLVLALGVGVSSDGGGDDNDDDEQGSRASEGEEEDKDENWASAFGVVTLASLFPVIVVLLFGIVASLISDVDSIVDTACEVSMGVPNCHNGEPSDYCNSALAPANPIIMQENPKCFPIAADDSKGASSCDDTDDQTPFRLVVLSDMKAGLQAVCPLVLFLVCVLKFVLTANIPDVALPDPLNPDPAADKSKTTIHVSWGALFALIGMIIFYVGLQIGLIALGTKVGGILPQAFTYTDCTPGKPPSDGASGDDEPDPDGILHCNKSGCAFGVTLVAMFAWFLGFGATMAEPALNTLGLTVERLTKGKFKRAMLIGAVSFGVATGITIGVLRLIYGLDLVTNILLPGYTIALILSALSTEEYICVAWDSAGVTTGPITVPLVVSMGLGISDALKIKDGFGILACASVSPIISVLATGLWVNGIVNPFAKQALTRTSSSSSGSSGVDRPMSLTQPLAQPAPQPAQQLLIPQVSEGDATTQLRLAAGAGDEDGVAKELAHGADVDAADTGGQTALYKAAHLGNVVIVKLLLDGGADVNKHNSKNWTPLMDSAVSGHVEVVKVLLGRGADPTIKNQRGKTALDLAKACPEICALLPSQPADPGGVEVASDASRPASPQRQAGVSRPASPQRQSGGQFVA